MRSGRSPVVTSLPSPALTADPLGQRLWQLFGGNPWDFLEAPTPSPGDKPQWRTVKNYPLRPRILWQRWKDATTLIGVRFKSQTYYALIDIDAGSPYCNPEAIAQLRASLETIGITRLAPCCCAPVTAMVCISMCRYQNPSKPLIWPLLSKNV